MHDDELMLRMADRIIDGAPNSWDQYALLKEPGYPYFLALCLKIGISPVLVVHLILLVSAYWLFHSFRKLVAEHVAAYCTIAICLNPANFGIGASRIYSVYFVTALVVALIAATIQVVCAARTDRGSLRGLLVGTAVLAVVTGAMSISRPDGLIIAFLAVGAFAFWNLLLRTREKRSKYIYSIVLVTMIFSVISFNGIVKSAHVRAYDVSVVNDLNYGNFNRLMESLASVIPDESLNFVVLSQATIKQIEELSPTFDLLTPFLESRDGELWQSITCDAGGPCNEVAGGFMPFLLRDAILASFQDVDANDFQQITGRIADEIEASCESGMLKCGSRGIGVWLPPLERLDLALTSREVVRLLSLRAYSFSDTLYFVNNGDPTRASSNAGSMWKVLKDEQRGSRMVSESGTPIVLQGPIRAFFRFASVVIQIFASFGTFVFLILIWKSKDNRQICRFGVSMLLSVFAILLLNSLMFANSFGRNADGGNLAYLLMVQPLVIGVSAVGLEMFSTRRHRPTLQPATFCEIRESNK